MRQNPIINFLTSSAVMTKYESQYVWLSPVAPRTDCWITHKLSLVASHKPIRSPAGRLVCYSPGRGSRGAMGYITLRIEFQSDARPMRPSSPLLPKVALAAWDSEGGNKDSNQSRLKKSRSPRYTFNVPSLSQMAAAHVRAVFSS
jgi:hypothetical protein